MNTNNDSNDIIFPGTPIPKEEETRRLEASMAFNQKVLSKADGKVVKVESMPDSDYIGYYMESGAVHTVHRADALIRAAELLKFILAETAGADKHVVQYDVWLTKSTFDAAIKNGRARGKLYNTPAIKQFEQQLMTAERTWSMRPESFKKTPSTGLHEAAGRPSFIDPGQVRRIDEI
jgi:hypothetical protein